MICSTWRSKRVAWVERQVVLTNMTPRLVSQRRHWLIVIPFLGSTFDISGPISPNMLDPRPQRQVAKPARRLCFCPWPVNARTQTNVLTRYPRPGGLSAAHGRTAAGGRSKRANRGDDGLRGIVGVAGTTGWRRLCRVGGAMKRPVRCSGTLEGA